MDKFNVECRKGSGFWALFVRIGVDVRERLHGSRGVHSPRVDQSTFTRTPEALPRNLSRHVGTGGLLASRSRFWINWIYLKTLELRLFWCSTLWWQNQRNRSVFANHHPNTAKIPNGAPGLRICPQSPKRDF